MLEDRRGNLWFGTLKGGATRFTPTDTLDNGEVLEGYFTHWTEKEGLLLKGVRSIMEDSQGRLWIATDGNAADKTGRADGVWAMETDGEARGTSKHFFRVPVGAELCGPEFAPGDTELFVAVQHPGEEDLEGKGATFENPGTRWPDFDEAMPVRPSVLVIRKDDGGTIGS